MKNAMLALFVGLLMSCPTLAQKHAPRSYIDKGACPGECCTYRQWKTEKATPLFSRPDIHSAGVGIARAGSSVKALTGEVHTIASRFIVKKTHGRYRPGDVLWVYTYIGEGLFKVWFKGRMREEGLEFSPWGGSSGTRCEQAGMCWGELDRELKFTWWIKIRTANGVEGWTNQGKNFTGADACS
jgi:hypothetical protein